MKRLLFLLAVLAFPATAQAQVTPSLSLDKSFGARAGIAADNFATDFAVEAASDVAVVGERVYTVGWTTVGNDLSSVVVARRKDGTYDTGFSGDGKLIIPLGAANEPDHANAVVALPDGRLRIAGDVDNGAGTDKNEDIVVFGLLPNGDMDPSFGDGGDGIQVHSLGTGNEAATRMAINAQGQILLGGYTAPSNLRDTFIARLDAGGALDGAFGAGGFRIIPSNPNGLNDEAKDVVFRPGGVAALIQMQGDTSTSYGNATAKLIGLLDDGSDDPGFGAGGATPLPVGGAPVNPLALLVHGGRIWITGNALTGVSQDAFLARVEADGSALQARSFDMRGAYTGTDPIASSGGSLVVLPGPPETLVVVGNAAVSGSSTQFAAAAFYGFDGDLAAAPYGDVVIESPEQALLNSAAVEGATSLVAGGLLFNTSGNLDQSLGTVRLLLDADKQCDLAIDVPTPLELTFVGRRGTAAQISVENKGTRPCAGTVGLAAPYKLGRAISTGVLAPGARFVTEGVPVTAATIKREDDVARFTVSAPGDSDASNDVRGVRAVFSFCDLALSAVEKPSTVPSEGARRVEVGLRNAGTRTCRSVRMRVTGGTGGGASKPYAIDRGRSVSDDVDLGVRAGVKVGRRVTLGVRTSATDEDVVASNDTIRLSMRVVGVGDTRVGRAGASSISGTASGGKGTKRDARGVRLARVEVAVRRLGGGCRWLSGKNARFVTRKSGSCTPTGWQSTSGKGSWRFSMRSLPAGRYEVYTRAVTANGFREARFTRSDRNRVAFRVR